MEPLGLHTMNRSAAVLEPFHAAVDCAILATIDGVEHYLVAEAAGEAAGEANIEWIRTTVAAYRRVAVPPSATDAADGGPPAHAERMPLRGLAPRRWETRMTSPP